MNQYEITTEKKKKAIVNAALILFRDNGFTNVSMKEIASLAHVSQVSIYNYFGNKETLVAECAKIIMNDTYQQAIDILVKEISFTEKMRLALSLCTESINVCISEFFTQEALRDSALVELLTKNINASKNKIYREYIQLGKHEKVINNNIPTEILLDFMEALNTMGNKWEASDEMTEKIKHIHSLFLYGIMGKE